jgi:hypothetical protein
MLGISPKNWKEAYTLYEDDAGDAFLSNWERYKKGKGDNPLHWVPAKIRAAVNQAATRRFRYTNRQKRSCDRLAMSLSDPISGTEGLQIQDCVPGGEDPLDVICAMETVEDLLSNPTPGVRLDGLCGEHVVYSLSLVAEPWLGE